MTREPTLIIAQMPRFLALGVRREMPRHVFTSPLNPEAEFLFQEPRVRE